MFASVNRSFFRRIVLALVAAQLLCAPPVASALANLAAAGATTDHCAQGMPASHESDSCPCCPDGGMSVGACLSACAASVGWVSALVFTDAAVAGEAVPQLSPAPLAIRAYPPLDPPPIV